MAKRTITLRGIPFTRKVGWRGDEVHVKPTSPTEGVISWSNCKKMPAGTKVKLPGWYEIYDEYIWDEPIIFKTQEVTVRELFYQFLLLEWDIAETPVNRFGQTLVPPKALKRLEEFEED